MTEGVGVNLQRQRFLGRVGFGGGKEDERLEGLTPFPSTGQVGSLMQVVGGGVEWQQAWYWKTDIHIN